MTLDEAIGYIQSLCDAISDQPCGCDACPYGDTVDDDGICDVMKAINKAGDADNGCTDDDTAEWIDKEVRGTMTNVCSVCGSCSVYPDKYCGGCGRSMKNGY